MVKRSLNVIPAGNIYLEMKYCNIWESIIRENRHISETNAYIQLYIGRAAADMMRLSCLEIICFRFTRHSCGFHNYLVKLQTIKINDTRVLCHRLCTFCFIKEISMPTLYAFNVQCLCIFDKRKVCLLMLSWLH